MPIYVQLNSSNWGTSSSIITSNVIIPTMSTTASTSATVYVTGTFIVPNGWITIPATFAFSPPAAPRIDATETRIANLRAERLLLQHLSLRQREQLKLHGYFEVPKGERVYRIHRGRSRNVELVDARGHRLKTYCAHPRQLVPDADTMLGQKFMLEAEEAAFLAVANVSP